MQLFSVRLPGVAAAILWAGGAFAADHPEKDIYRCTLNGTTVYSDVACAGAEGATKVDVRVANGYTPVAPVAETKRPETKRVATKPAKTAVRDSSATVEEDHRKQCLSMKRSLDQIYSKMRSGYRVREGERLRERETQLSERLREEHCH